MASIGKGLFTTYAYNAPSKEDEEGDDNDDRGEDTCGRGAYA